MGLFADFAAYVEDLVEQLQNWTVFDRERVFVTAEALGAFIGTCDVLALRLLAAGVEPKLAIMAGLYRNRRTIGTSAVAHFWPLQEHLKQGGNAEAEALERECATQAGRSKSAASCHPAPNTQSCVR